MKPEDHLKNFATKHEVQKDILWRIQSDFEFLMKVKEYNKEGKVEPHLTYLTILVRNDMILLAHHLVSSSRNDEFSFTKSIRILGFIKKTFDSQRLEIFSKLSNDLEVIRFTFKELSFIDIRNKYIAHIDKKRTPLSFEWVKADKGIGLLYEFYNNMALCTGRSNIYRTSAIDMGLFIRQDKTSKKISDFAIRIMPDNPYVGSEILKLIQKT
jgi:hypothetical protein